MGFDDVLTGLIADEGFMEGVYDRVRLLDPVSKKVLAVLPGGAGKGTAEEAKQKCYAFFHRQAPYITCASMLAISRGEQLVKIDYAHPDIYLAVIKPVLNNEKWYALELLKNITDCGIVGLMGQETFEISQLLAGNNNMMLLDAFTKIYGSIYIDSRLPHDIYLAGHEGRRLNVFLISILNLQEIIDLHGEQAGDSILKQFVTVLKRFSRKPDDWSARYAQNELLTVMHNLDEKQTLRACKLLQDRLRKVRIPGNDAAARAVFTIGRYTLGGEDMTMEELISAARKNTFHSAENPQAFQRAAQVRKAFPDCGFSERELEVAALLLTGKSNLEIAQALFISLSTVKKHISGVFAKTRLKSRAEFIAKVR